MGCLKLSFSKMWNTLLSSFPKYEQDLKDTYKVSLWLNSQSSRFKKYSSESFTQAHTKKKKKGNT